MLHEKVFFKRPSAFLVYNTQECYDIVDSIDDFYRPGEITVVYQFNDDIILMHPEKYNGEAGARSAIRHLIKKIETSDIHSQKSDEKIRETTGDPTFTTRKVLLDFLREELKAIQ
jgi:hypothetical protein